MIESLPEFTFGNRQSLKLFITKPGDVAKGILDFGTVESAEGAHFEGYIAAVKINDETPLSMVLDSGRLKLPDGRVLTGDFTISYREKWTNTYFEIVTGAFIPFS